MGLDITAYNEVKVVKDAEPQYYFYKNGEQSNMPELEGEVEMEFLEEFDFRAGSYEGYNQFRNYLCKTINSISDSELWELVDNKDESVKKLPFYYLINFSDCEGYIGTSYCEILYKDFLENKDVFIKNTDHERIINTYNNFLQAFEIGKQNGVVNFY